MFTEHPIENLTREQLWQRAEQLDIKVVNVLTGDVQPQVE